MMSFSPGNMYETRTLYYSGCLIQQDFYPSYLRRRNAKGKNDLNNSSVTAFVKRQRYK